jgi:hypothetical protein
MVTEQKVMECAHVQCVQEVTVPLCYVSVDTCNIFMVPNYESQQHNMATMWCQMKCGCAACDSAASVSMLSAMAQTHLVVH